MGNNQQLSRRTLLRGAAGVAIGLPMLDAMLPVARGSRVALRKPPVRMAFILMGMGVNMDHWFPQDAGPNYTLSRALKPLAPHKQDFSVITGTKHIAANKGGHGSSKIWLTGCDTSATPGYDFKNSVSVDQLAAATLGQQTRIPSLQLGIYSSHYGILSWTREGTPLPTIKEPIDVFDYLFSERESKNVNQKLKKLRQQKSILDFALESARSLNRDLGTADRRKLDEYLTAIREVEQRIAQAEKWASVPRPKPPIPAPARNAKRGGGDIRYYLRTMYDLIAIAFQADLTRVVAFQAYSDSNNARITESGAWEGWHTLTHNNGDEEKLEQLAMIDEFHSKHFAGMLERFKSVREADGSSLLDHSMLLYGESMTTGNRHWGGNLPLVVAGHGGGGLQQGQHIKLCESPSESRDTYTEATTPTSNLFVSMLNQAGIPTKRFADSTGPLKPLHA